MKNSLTKSQDAYGQAFYDYYRGSGSAVIIERDDGYIDFDTSLVNYFKNVRQWKPDQKKAIGHCTGRVLDIGCGAGQHSLYLQDKGFDVLGIDVSPLAIKTCKLRGLKQAKVLSIDGISRRLGRFDTILMFGNNFGLFGNVRKAKQLLKRFHTLTSPDARIIAQCLNPLNTTNPHHLKYHRRNRARGRLPGQLNIRVRYQEKASPWFDFIFVTPDEMHTVLNNTGWQIRKFISGSGTSYFAVIEKE